MILLLRIIPFSLFLLLSLGGLLLVRLPTNYLPIVSLIVGVVFLVFLLMFILTGGRKAKTIAFVFALLTSLFTLSVFLFQLFVELPVVHLFLTFFSAGLVFLFAETVFTFAHTPTVYQPFSLEHLSHFMALTSGFFFFNAFFGLQSLVFLPFSFLIPLVFLFLFGLFGTTFWVTKIDWNRAKLYSLGGAVLFTELYAVCTFLPTSYALNAAVLSLFIYLYLGIVRAFFLQKLTRAVLQRYFMVVGVGLLFLFGTAQWL